MSFTDAIKSVFSQYANFSGRARRSEYWYFVLFNLVVTAVLRGLGEASGIFSVIAGLASLALFVPGIAVAVRRLHDIGKSGWFFLFVLIPVVGAIILIIWYCKDSDPGDNAYGPNPKATTV